MPRSESDFHSNLTALLVLHPSHVSGYFLPRERDSMGGTDPSSAKEKGPASRRALWWVIPSVSRFGCRLST